MQVHLDLTELVRHPLRSGIQRVEREAIRHWDGPPPIPCVVDAQGRLLRLDPDVLDALSGHGRAGPAGRAAEKARLARVADAGQPVDDADVGRLLNLELFYDPVRADAHRRMAANGVEVLYYLYDFLPFLRPELFPPGTTQACMHFLRGVRSAEDRLAFLSPHTRDDFARRIARRPTPAGGWPVLSPGADGLGLERQEFRPDRRRFVSIGTVEARKNTGALLDAFELLWARGIPAELTVAGRVEAGQQRLQELAERHPGRFAVLDEPSDDQLRDLLRHARAVVMPSEAEGFGLPPYEALHAGIAAIASAHLPSAGAMTAGAVLLDRMNAPSIAGAVERLMDDAVAAGLWDAAAGLHMPTWRDFGRALSTWATQAPA